jgi:hypothetical protein
MKVDRWLAAAVLVTTLSAPQWAIPAAWTAPATPVTPVTPVAGPAEPVAWDEAAARAQAQALGRAVEVASLTTTRERLLANPDGTWTYEQHTQAVRARRADGSWAPVDTRLRRLDGRVRPAASAVGMWFSAGGTGPVARIARASRSLSMTLPWRLPAPVLSGPRATYREVLPGVDLVVVAEPASFSEVLVVKTREAAANPALATLRLQVKAPGLSLRAAGGGFVAEDAAGAVVFASPAPSMWDSGGAGAYLLHYQQ